jgi:hypothetical protein
MPAPDHDACHRRLNSRANLLSPFMNPSFKLHTRNDHCFHTVGPITDAGARRDLLRYDIRVEHSPQPSPRGAAANSLNA